MQVGQECNIEDMRRAKNTPPKFVLSSSGEGEDDFHYSPTERGRFFTTAAKDRLKKKSER